MLIMMPFLGGNQAEWTEVVDVLSLVTRCVTLDLPGFGAASDLTGYSVEEMSDKVIDTLRVLAATEYVLIGHSMAGKVSAVVTRRLVNGGGTLAPPAALVLVSPSPPAPEPMTEAKRAEMLAMFGSKPRDGDLAAAAQYIASNVSAPLPPTKARRTAEGVVAMNREAWSAWLKSGSREDWSDAVGRIDLPVLVVAGKHDASLGPAAQRKATLPHFPAAKLIEFDCGHLAPLEMPEELAHVIQRFVAARVA